MGKERVYHRFDRRVRHRLKHLVIELEFWSQVDIGALVLCRIAILRCGEDGDTASVVLDLVTLHADLVRTDNGLETVFLTEPLGDIGTELETNASLAGSTARCRLRVCPEHLHHQTLLAGLALVVSVQFPDVVQGCVVVREETTVQNQVFAANQSGQGQSGERLGEDLEYPLVVLGLAFSFETINLVHIVRLVVATVEEDPVGTKHLVCVEEQGDFCRPRATVDKVSVEEVCMLLRGVSVSSEDFEKIEELTYCR